MLLNVKKFKDINGTDIFVNLDLIDYFYPDENRTTNIVWLRIGEKTIGVESSIEDFCKVIESTIRRNTNAQFR